ncbi:MAG: ATP-binding cassette domain-containing protein, partial [Deltaproteobacteria bacterium]
MDFGGVKALVNVDFHVDEGTIVGLIGANGAGKTTLFSVISGFLFLLFEKKRGLAIGVMSTGVGVGGFIFSLLVGSLLIPTYGWQG